jgi:hypothetical protein
LEAVVHVYSFAIGGDFLLLSVKDYYLIGAKLTRDIGIKHVVNSLFVCLFVCLVYLSIFGWTREVVFPLLGVVSC